MSSQLADRLQEKNRTARAISIVYKTERTGSSHAKSLTLPEPIYQSNPIYKAVLNLYQEHLVEVPLRLFGVRLSNIEELQYEQLTLQELLLPEEPRGQKM